MKKYISVTAGFLLLIAVCLSIASCDANDIISAFQDGNSSAESAAELHNNAENISLNTNYTVHRSSSSGDFPDDSIKLTDGIFASGALSNEVFTLIRGNGLESAYIIIELAESGRIDNVSVSITLPESGVFPENIKIYTSQNGKTYTKLGSALSFENAVISQKTKVTGCNSYTVSSDNRSSSTGKYVRIEFDSSCMFYCDEITVTGFISSPDTSEQSNLSSADLSTADESK